MGRRQDYTPNAEEDVTRIARQLARYAVLVLLVSCAGKASAQDRVGHAAPPLHFDALLQAPAGARTDWPSLRGKVVVLEFWATWCLKCVEDFPRLNELASSVDSSKVVFVAITDEESDVVQHLLNKRKLASWVAIDKAGTTFRSYGVEARPTTVVVDTAGRIVAVTDPESLQASELAELTKGRNTFPKATLTSVKPTSDHAKGLALAGNQEEPRPSLEVSASPSKRGSSPYYESSHSGDENFKGLSAESALTLAYSVSSKRIHLDDPLPDTPFDLKIHGPYLSSIGRLALLKTLTSTLFNLQVTPITANEEVYVLTRNAKVAPALTEAAMSLDMTIMLDQGDHYLVPGRTVAQLGSALESTADLPVVDETGASGAYDWQLAKGDFAAQRSDLLSRYGIHIEKELRTIPVIEVRAVK